MTFSIVPHGECTNLRRDRSMIDEALRSCLITVANGWDITNLSDRHVGSLFDFTVLVLAPGAGELPHRYWIEILAR